MRGPKRALASNPGALPALLAAVVLLVMAASEGGYPTTTWYPAALGFLGLLAVSLLAIGAPRPSRAAVIASAGLFAYAAWAYISITWADQQGDAWDGANRVLTYALLFTLFALFPLRANAAALVVGLLGAGIAVIGAVELLRIAASSQPDSYFIGTRLAEPTGYQNANVALWMTGLWPCLVAATRSELPAPLRGLALGGAGLLAQLALAGQSRGWLFALPLAVVVLLVVTPGRLRLAAAAAAVGLAVIATSGPVVALSEDFTTGPELGALVDDAARAMLFAAAALAALGTLAMWGGRIAESRGVSVPTPRLGRTALIGAAVAGVVLVAGVAIATNPIDTVGDKWDEFKSGAEPDRQDRLTASLGTNRYDFWTVALDHFEEQPLRGIGADNFQIAYLAEGKSQELPRFPHSFELGVLSQTGIVGALLLFGALGAGVFAAVGAVRRRAGLAAAVAGAALTMFAYWFLHASVDWFWEFPALAGIAVAMLGLAAGLGAPSDLPEEPRARGKLALAATLALAFVFAALFAMPWTAERGVRRAADEWREHPARALDRLDQSAKLNPLSPRPDLVAGSIALRLGDFGLAEDRFARAREREPQNHYAVLELGLVAAQSGDAARARELLGQARRLSPRDDVTLAALQALRDGEEIDINALNRSIHEVARDRVGNE